MYVSAVTTAELTQPPPFLACAQPKQPDCAHFWLRNQGRSSSCASGGTPSSAFCEPEVSRAEVVSVVFSRLRVQLLHGALRIKATTTAKTSAPATDTATKSDAEASADFDEDSAPALATILITGFEQQTERSAAPHITPAHSVDAAPASATHPAAHWKVEHA